MKRNGQVLRVTDATQSRRVAELTTQDYGVQRVTFMPGILGTDAGLEVADRASDLRRVTFDERRRSARDDKKG